MTNIWANSFEEVRKLHFEMEDPYTSIEEKKNYSSSKDQDGDGDNDFADNMVARMVASGKMTKAQAIAKTKNKSYNKEEVELDEAEKWIQKAIKHPGALHKQLGVPEGEKIPAGKLKAAAEKGGTLGKRARLAQTLKSLHKEETLYTSKAAQEKIDVRKGIKNKITISPQVREEVETWVAELVEEGYDLSEFTWEDMTNIYLDEAGTSAMAPRGDYQTDVATATQKKDPNAPLIAAKANAAKARIRSDYADAQLAKTSAKYESAILYLAQRPDAFENLEEGVFDPKKSKMRSASERSQRTMTAAQRTAAKKAAERTAQIHSKGETVLTGLTKPQRKSSQPMGSTQPSKPAAPTANRKVAGKYDQLAKKASSILRDIQTK